MAQRSPYTTVGTRRTPQSQPVPGRNMVKNKAGGYAFQANDFDILRRFLVLGTVAGTYYTSPHDLTKENVEVVLRCIEADPKRTIETIASVSAYGIAPNNDPALLSLAMAASSAEMETRKLALEVLPEVARIPTHLFHFVQYTQQFRGWGRGLRSAVAKWYLSQTPEHMAFHAAKYQQRDGWAHSDLLRLAHPKGASDLQSVVFRWMMGKELSEEDYRKFAILDGYRKVHAATTAKEVAKLVEEYQLPREIVPTQWLTSRDVWDALLVTMPVGAMIRNLGKMGSLGLLDDLTDTQAFVESKLLYGPGLKKARVHPMAIFVAQLVYGQGRGVKGSLNWPVRARIQDALNEAFVLSFEYVEPTNKKLIVAVDESGSMSSPIANPNIQLRAYNAAVAMAYIIARTEPNIHVIGFDTEVRNFSMSGKQRLQDVLSRSNSGGGTNCSLPFSYARNYGVEVDGIVLLTDSESWAGDEHVFQAADRYRRERNADMRFVTVQMTANSTMLRDPLDNLKSLEVVGFDTTVPVLMSDFLGGKF